MSVMLASFTLKGRSAARATRDAWAGTARVAGGVPDGTWAETVNVTALSASAIDVLVMVGSGTNCGAV